MAGLVSECASTSFHTLRCGIHTRMISPRASGGRDEVKGEALVTIPNGLECLVCIGIWAWHPSIRTASRDRRQVGKRNEEDMAAGRTRHTLRLVCMDSHQILLGLISKFDVKIDQHNRLKVAGMTDQTYTQLNGKQLMGNNACRSYVIENMEGVEDDVNGGSCTYFSTYHHGHFWPKAH